MIDLSKPPTATCPVRFRAISKVTTLPIEMWFRDEASADQFATLMTDFYVDVEIKRIPTRSEMLTPMAMCIGGYLAALSDGIHALKKSQRTHAAMKLGELLALLGND